MPTIRIDEEVWAWLQTRAKPFEDTPNSVLRRIASLDERGSSTNASASRQETRPSTALGSARGNGSRRTRRSGREYSGLTGRQLNMEWEVGASHALYHKEGSYYNHLQYFPGALFDPNGFVRFETEEEYRKSPYLQHGQQLHVAGGISSMPGYVRRRK